MAILGLGTDIVEVERFFVSLSRFGESFAREILTHSEFLHFKKKRQAHRFLAKRFAAKEAAAKAMGTGISRGLSFQDFAVESDELGKPTLILLGVAADIAAKKGILHHHVSISDERLYAVATVIFES